MKKNFKLVNSLFIKQDGLTFKRAMETRTQIYFVNSDDGLRVIVTDRERKIVLSGYQATESLYENLTKRTWIEKRFFNSLNIAEI